MISTPVPSKSGRLRVASAAPRERQTAAMSASKPASGFPARSRALAMIAYCSAAAASTGRICSSKALKVSFAVSSRACFLRPARQAPSSGLQPEQGKDPRSRARHDQYPA
jgi:hypothetical protein